MTNAIKLDCKACNQPKTMIPTKISKMSPIVVFIGWIMTLPSIFGIVIAIILFFASISAGSEVSAQAGSQAEATGAALGAGLGASVSIFIGISSLVGGLLGYLLIMKKNVYKCGSCGFIMDRA